MYATPGSARYAVAPREDGLCDDKSESLFKFILSFVLDCPKLSIRFVQRFLSVNNGLFFHHLFGTDVLSETERAAVLERIERIVRASAREGAEVTECADGCDGSDAEKSETGK